jgi:hypothetical protein
MNQTDKKELLKVMKGLKVLSPIVNQVVNQVKEREQIQFIIEELKKIEPTLEDQFMYHQDKFDDLSDRAKETYKGEVMEKIAGELERAFDNLQECINRIESIIED